MKWYTAIGCKMEDDEGRLLVKIDGQEKVLTEMEGMLGGRRGFFVLLKAPEKTWSGSGV